MRDALDFTYSETFYVVKFEDGRYLSKFGPVEVINGAHEFHYDKDSSDGDAQRSIESTLKLLKIDRPYSVEVIKKTVRAKYEILPTLPGVAYPVPENIE